MSKLSDCNSTTRRSLGKGEVHSSILCGSTRKAHEIGLSESPAETISAVSGRTPPEHDATSRGESVDSVPVSAQRLARQFERWLVAQDKTLWPDRLCAAGERARLSLHARVHNEKEPTTDLQEFLTAHAEFVRAA